MKASFKNSKLALATFFFFIALLTQVAPAFATSPPNDCECPSPAVTITSQSSNAVSFSWGSVTGASGYSVWYVRRGDNFISQVLSTVATSVNFTNLPAGTYKFYFQTECEDEDSQIIITDDLIML